jgi:hypothetical protein
MIQTDFDLARGVLFELSSGQSAFHSQPNLVESLYSEICFGIEFCNLGFEIWNLTNLVWKRIYDYVDARFVDRTVGRNIHRGCYSFFFWLIAAFVSVTCLL